MNQTTKRPPGRPKKAAPAAAVAETPAKQQPKKKAIRRQEKVSATQEYKANGSGAVMMLMQSGITVYDEERQAWCERFAIARMKTLSGKMNKLIGL